MNFLALKLLSLTVLLSVPFVFESPKSMGDNSIVLDNRTIESDKAKPINGWQMVSNSVDKGKRGMLGRTTCIYVDEVNDKTLNTVYIGTENSGLWKTSNFNDQLPNWVCLTEKSRLPGVGVVDIDVDPYNANNIFIATAVGVGFEWQYGLGVLRTNNGGKTWYESSISLNEKNISNTICQRVKIIEPKKNGKHVIVAHVGRQIFRSIDGGQNFLQVYSLPEPSNKLSTTYLNDLVQGVSNKKVLVASSVDHYNKNGGAKLLISKNQGQNWSDISAILSQNGQTPHTPTEFIRIDLAVCPQKGDRLFVYAVSNSKKRSLYLIDNYWTSDIKVQELVNHSGLGSYFMSDIEVSRINPNKVYLGRVQSRVIDLTKTKNGVFYYYTHEGSTVIHPDKRDYYIVGNSKEEILYCANDGGVAVCQKNESGKYEWINKTGNGLAITQFYGLGLSLKAQQYAGGAQDLGAFVFGKTYKHYYIGDGYQAEIDSIRNKLYLGYNNKVGAYPSSAYGGTTAIPMGRNNSKFEIWPNGTLVGAGFATGSRGDQTLKSGLRGNFIFFYNPNTKSYTHIKSYPYTNANQISKSTFEGSLQRVSALGVSHTTSSVFYIAGNRKSANKNRLWRIDLTKDNEPKWTSLTQELKHSSQRLAPWQFWQSISTICVDAHNENQIWIGFTDNLHEKSQKVAYHPNTQDFSENSKWIFINQGLPNFPVNHIEQDPNTGFLYVATDVGVFMNRNPKSNTSAWESYNYKLPVIKVTDIEVDRNEIYVSTYGRGIWKAKTHK
ncbi:MAG: hypothetical protein ACPGLV_07635 [Bacteroidia bacterium]